ncbi:MAG: hypothetical protein HQK53_12520 [Oligoflexia bacterium]|nr:hypothetical protein [Oligoflexia bacterium]
MNNFNKSKVTYPANPSSPTHRNYPTYIDHFLFFLTAIVAGNLLLTVSVLAFVGVDCTLEPSVIVSDQASINGRTKIKGQVIIKDYAWIEGEVDIEGPTTDSGDDPLVIDGHARIVGNVKIIAQGHIGDNAWISGNADLRGNLEIIDNAKILDDVNIRGGKIILRDNTQLSEQAQLFGNVTLSDYVVISGQAKIIDSKLGGIISVVDGPLEIVNKNLFIPVPDLQRFPYHTKNEIPRQVIDCFIAKNAAPGATADFSAEVSEEVSAEAFAEVTERAVKISNPQMDNKISIISEEKAQFLMTTFFQDVSLRPEFPYDGCFNRAHSIAMKLEQRFGIRVGKAFLEVPALFSSNLGGTLIPWEQSTHQLSLMFTDRGQIERELKWLYHTAPIILVRKISQRIQEISGTHQIVPMVFDPLFGDKPISSMEWYMRLTARLSNEQQIRFYYAHRFAPIPAATDLNLNDYAAIDPDPMIRGSRLPVLLGLDRSMIELNIRQCFENLILQRSSDL